MYATTREMIDAVLEMINGGQPLPNFGGVTPGQVHMALNQARCKAVFVRHFQDRRMGDITIDDAFTVAYDNLEVKTDERRKSFYVELPVPFLDLPRLMGIVHVGPLEDPYTQYIVRTSGHLAVSQGSQAQYMGGIPFCYPEGNRLYLFNTSKTNASEVELLVKIVPGMGWDDIDAQTGIPSSMQEDIINSLVQKFSGVRATPADQSDDSNKNTV